MLKSILCTVVEKPAPVQEAHQIAPTYVRAPTAGTHVAARTEQQSRPAATQGSVR